MRDYVSMVRALLGPGASLYAEFDAWRDVEEAWEFRLPGDYKELADAYAPVQIYDLRINHPGNKFIEGGDEFGRTIAAFADVDWDPQEHQFGPEGPRFGVPGGLYPLASTDRGEELFSAADENNVHDFLMVFDGEEGEFFEYYMSFAEWVYRYLIGQDMCGPRSAIDYPRPVKLQRPPLEPGGRTVTWYGPEN